jgi:mandelate racemase
VLVDLTASNGETGRCYIFTYTPVALASTARMISDIAEAIIGQPISKGEPAASLNRRFTLMGTQGVVGMAIAAIDMACWDVLARTAGQPLFTLAEGKSEPCKAYASLRGWTAAQLAEESGTAAAQGFKAVKLKFGHPALEAEREVYDAVRDAVGSDVKIFVDPNQAFTVEETIRRAPHYLGWGIKWLEEPIRGNDLKGFRAIRAACPGLPLQRGENDFGPEEIEVAIASGASHYLMPDMMKVGGVTGWLKAADLCAAASMPMSSHLYIEYSSHMLSLATARHWLERLDIAGPVLKAGRPMLEAGMVTPLDAPGAGFEWDEAAVAKYAA